MPVRAFISGCAGPALSREEIAFFKDAEPWGLILFARNCVTAGQIRDLVAAFRDSVGRADAPVLIDQEGGRVQRLRPPGWPDYPPGRVIGMIGEADIEAGGRAAWLAARLIAADLTDLGIDVDCLPVLDLLTPETSRAIGDRAYGSDPHLVARLGRAAAAGLLAGGVLPAMKHMPGHGRATVDSHVSLPVVEAEAAVLEGSDFVPFAELADLPIGMTGHIVFTAFDKSRPATTSQTVIRDIIRGRINFAGLLLSDDMSMEALSGDYATRAAAIHAAGCDLVLHCNGRIEEMRAVAAVAPVLAGTSGERAQRALAWRHAPEPFDRKAGRAELLALAARAGWAEKERARA